MPEDAKKGHFLLSAFHDDAVDDKKDRDQKDPHRDGNDPDHACDLSEASRQ